MHFVRYGYIRRVITAALAGCMALGMAAGLTGCARRNEGNTGTPAPTEDPGPVTLEDLQPVEFYRNGYTYGSLVGIDQFARTFEAVRGEREGQHDVGLFYFCTLGQHNSRDIYDVSKILAMPNGIETMFHSSGKTAPAGETYFWGEPLFGYYNSTDIWVIRRHLALLTAAGVDFLVFDVTNAFTYNDVVGRIVREAMAMIQDGWDVPRLAFYTNAYSMRVTEQLYRTYYTTDRYDAVWYHLDGKPLIIACTDPNTDRKEALGRGDQSYNPAPYPAEILERFTFRDPQWPSVAFKENGFPWIEWQYPAPVHNGVINVAVASHPALPMSFSVTRDAQNWGRGWNVETQRNESEHAYEGPYFQATWNVAIEADPRIVFVLGWNEWTAGKSMYDGEYALVDCATMEFSRDAEMMKGGYNDAFFIQLAANIRRYKALPLQGTEQIAGAEQTMDLQGDLAVWDGVPAVFRESIQRNVARNADGAAPTVHYSQDAARNNIQEIRVCRDAEYFYFYVRTEKPVTERETGDTGWMNLLIGTGRVAAKGWEGYEYVVNRQSAGEGRCTVERLAGDFTSEPVGEAEIAVRDNVLLLKVPRAAVGLAEDAYAFYFKMADAIEVPSDIMDYYVSGKSLPLGRLSFRYLG